MVHRVKFEVNVRPETSEVTGPPGAHPVVQWPRPLGAFLVILVLLDLLSAELSSGTGRQGHHERWVWALQSWALLSASGQGARFVPQAGKCRAGRINNFPTNQGAGEAGDGRIYLLAGGREEAGSKRVPHIMGL